MNIQEELDEIAKGMEQKIAAVAEIIGHVDEEVMRTATHAAYLAYLPRLGEVGVPVALKTVYNKKNGTTSVSFEVMPLAASANDGAVH